MVSRSWPWLCVAICAGVGCSSDDSNPTPRYRIELLGSKSAHDRFDLRLSGASEEGFTFRQNAFVRTFEAVGDLEAVALDGLSMQTVAADGWLVDSIVLRPFLCAMDPEWLQAELRAGKVLVETHQVLLTDEGFLRRDSDFGIELSHSCESLATDGSGDGFATPAYRTGYCRETPTAVQLVQDADGALTEPTSCLAVHFDRHAGELSLGLTFEPPHRPTVTAHLGHCFDPDSTMLPLALVVGDGFPVPGCDMPLVLEWVSDDTGPAYVPASSGHLTIRALEFRSGGRIAGEIDAHYGEPGSGYRIHGTFDLPLLRLSR